MLHTRDARGSLASALDASSTPSLGAAATQVSRRCQMPWLRVRT